MAIDVSGANAYFGPTVHTRATVWAKYPDGNQRAAAVAHAKALIKRLLPSHTDLVETATTADDFPRHDAAVYEQALHMLENGPAGADGNQTAPRHIVDPDDKTKPLAAPRVPLYAPEAMRWLCDNPGAVVLGRG